MSDDVTSNITVEGYVTEYNPVPILNDTDEGKPPSKSLICVQWKITSDEGLADVVDNGTAYTTSDVDYTVKVGRPPSARNGPIPE